MVRMSDLEVMLAATWEEYQDEQDLFGLDWREHMGLEDALEDLMEPGDPLGVLLAWWGPDTDKVA